MLFVQLSEQRAAEDCGCAALAFDEYNDRSTGELSDYTLR
jgi:hypothetical protein